MPRGRGRTGDRQDQVAVRAAAAGRGARLRGARGLGRGVRARSSVRGLGRRPRRLCRLPGPRRARGPRCPASRRPGARAAVAQPRRRDDCRRAGRRTPSGSSRRPRAAGSDRDGQAAGPGARRPALERRGVDRAAGRAPAPSHRRAGAARPRLSLGQGAPEARRGARGARRHDHRPRPAERGRVLDAGRRAPGCDAARGDLRAERRQPVLHVAAGACLGAPVAQLDRRSPGAGRRRSAHGRGGAGGGARDADRRYAPVVDLRVDRRRSVRARARIRDRRIVAADRGRGARRAARRAAASPHRRAAAVPVPAPARAPRRA